MAKTGINQVVKDIEHSPALLITLLVIVAAFLYFVIRNNGGSTSTTSSNSLTPGSSPYYVALVDDENPTASGTGTTVSTGSGSGTTGSTGNPTSGGTGNTGGSRTVTITKASSLETTPRDANGGHNILTVPQGGVVTILGGPVKDPQGSSKKYYQVSYNGQTGYIGSDAGSF